jgi:Trk K+ transport system NAD-binding subunit
VQHVISRVSDPLRGAIYEELGLHTVSPTVMGADTVFQLLTGKAGPAKTA